MRAASGFGADLLEAVVREAQDAGERLRAEFFRPAGPRGARGKAPIDTEIEDSLRTALQARLACSFLGEETGLSQGPLAGYRWLVDPHDGTSEFLKGNRGSAVSVALLRLEGNGRAEAVLGVVHSPLAPDRGADTIAWAQGCGPILRNGRPIEPRLARRRLERGEIVWLTASAALRPAAFSRALAPARFIAMPSIAYRLARVAVGDGAATLSLHSVNEYDIGAGAALVRAAGGSLRDRLGREIAFTGAENALVQGCFAGAPEAVHALASRDWESVLREPKVAPRVSLAFPRAPDEARLARAQGCLLGHVIGDRLGAQIEFRESIPGQPSGDGELALALARTLARERRYDAIAARAAYLEWRESGPCEASGSSGSLVRAAPIGIWAAGDPERAARTAREDSALTHLGAVCLEACAGYAAAISAGIAGGASDAMVGAALAQCSGAARSAIERAARGERQRGDANGPESVLIPLQNAFYQLLRAPGFEPALIETVGARGDADASGTIAGALLGAHYGRAAVPARWLLPLLACRPDAEEGAPQPRRMAYWPDDALDLAEALIAAPV